MIAALVGLMALASHNAIPHVESIWPAARSIPANILRIYVTFDHVARGRVSTRDLQLRDDVGRKVDGAFMDFGQDLWSPDGRRLTILFDPGRVKRDVEGDGESAAPLQVGHSYTVEVSGKQFRYHITRAVRTAIAPKGWHVSLPRAASRQPLEVRFHREMDAALLRDQLQVVDAKGRSQAGRVMVSAGGRVWTWRPEHDWHIGIYRIIVGTGLEDVSGNRIGEALDHNVNAREVTREGVTVRLLVKRHSTTSEQPDSGRRLFSE